MTEPVSLRGMVAELGDKIKALEAENEQLKAEVDRLKKGSVKMLPLEPMIAIIRKSYEMAVAAEQSTVNAAPVPEQPMPATNYGPRCEVCNGLLIDGNCQDCKEAAQLGTMTRPKEPAAGTNPAGGCPTCGGVVINGKCGDCQERRELGTVAKPVVKPPRPAL